MTNPNPATPGEQPVTPGSGEQNSNPPSVAPQAPATPAPGTNPEGTVVIPLKEYRELQRNDARARSFDKRTYRKPSSQQPNVEPDDPANAAIAEANQRAQDAERRAMQVEVKGKVRDLLADDRFKNIPKSTQDLILTQPHMLSSAETLEEAMYDIEDKLIEIAGSMQNDQQPTQTSTTQTPTSQPTQSQPQAQPQQQQPGSETPPSVTPGAPAPVDSQALEDISGLKGPARSMAVMRNAQKKQYGGVKQ